MTTKTHLTLTATKKTEGDESDDKLKMRAARFALPTSASTSIFTTKTASTSPVDVEKLTARATKFADVKGFTGTTLSSTAKVAASVNLVDPEKLAKRAARFGDIKVDTPRVSSKTFASGNVKSSGPSAISSVTGPIDSELLAKRAARFANMGSK